ncbi:MAG: hypothetical protein ABL898_19230 [Hyphomicrobiaceae bacterium]
MASRGEAGLRVLLVKFGPISVITRLATLVLLIGFPDKQNQSQPLCTALLPVSILIQVRLKSGRACLLNRAACQAHRVTAPSALDGPSKFFEFEVAVAINLFGYEPDSAQATVVGVLVEVSAMLSVD